MDGEVIFLDTTYLLPFFQIPVNVKDFSKRIFEETLRKFQFISVSELSLIEVLFIATKLYLKREVSDNIFKTFKENLTVLKEDDRFMIKTLSDTDVKNYKYLLDLKSGLNPIDRIILAQGANADIFLTEDKDLLELGKTKKFREKFSVNVVNWRQYIKLFK